MTFEEISERLDAGHHPTIVESSEQATRTHLGLTSAGAVLHSPGYFEASLRHIANYQLGYISIAELYKSGGDRYAEAYYRQVPLSMASFLSRILTYADPVESSTHAVRHCLEWHLANTNRTPAEWCIGAIHNNEGNPELILADALGFDKPGATELTEQQFERFKVLLEEIPKFTGKPCNLKKLYQGTLFHNQLATASKLFEMLPETVQFDKWDDDLATRCGHKEYFDRALPQLQPEEMDTPETKTRIFSAVRGSLAQGHLDLAKHLWARASFDTKEERDHIWESASKANFGKNDWQAVRWLVEEQGFKPYPKDDPVLANALYHGRTDMAKFLHTAGAHTQLKGVNLWQTSTENIRFAKSICDLRATCDFKNCETFKVDEEKADIVREILDTKSVRELCSRHKLSSLLHSACLDNDAPTVRLFLDLGADIQNQSIIWAASNDPQVLGLLLEREKGLAGRFQETNGILNYIKGEWGFNRITDKLTGNLHALREAGMVLRDSDLACITEEDVKPENVAFFTELSQFKGGDKLLNTCVGPLITSAQKNREQWQRRLHMDPPEGLELESPNGLKPSTFETVKEWMRNDMGFDSEHPRIPRAQINSYSYKLSVLFTTPDRVLQYLDRHGKVSITPLHDLAQFKMPATSEYDIKAWGDASLKFGPGMAQLLKFADKLGGKPLESLSKTREAVSQFAYERGSESPTLAAICFELQVSEEDFNTALEAHKTINLKHASQATPDITIDGDDFGMPGYEWKRAPVGDPRILIAGDLVNCCQHIGGPGEACAIHSARSSHGCAYYLTKPDKRGENIVAISWGWTSNEGTFCLDSFEPIDPIYGEAFPKIVEAMSLKLEAECPEIVNFTIGTGGRTPSLSYPVTTGAEPSDYSGYRDSHTQYVVFGSLADTSRTGDSASQLEQALAPERQPLAPGI